MRKGTFIYLLAPIILTCVVLIRNSELETNFLDKQFSEIEHYIPHKDSIDTLVSKVDVAWHLDHSLKTINKICEALEKSDPKAFKFNINLTRIAVFTYGDFTRGVAQSPKIVLPPKVIFKDSLYVQLEEASKNLVKIESLDTKAHFKHPYFNVLNKKQTKRFLKVHTHHHLKIIKDILKE
ncbi:DUF1569 domain-containing protein [Flagellimonas sp. 389]|uniref:DUF1569 domain-containing protein n=1 Tax=Flagellimonas sp. 389 TaxID=2835862 RepID=UPI001BD545F3|nr:DUF1569 domain-containing protein [Flagellimonas sp. 389]MBS9462448.1 DUF1569 domain-containing protein [Flagellimonas sp. 389]